jgi:toxin ParE1/3/4
MAAIQWSRSALKDLRLVHSYIAQDSKRQADRVVKEIRAAVKRIRTNPKIGWMVPEFNEDELREIVVFSYRIIYEIEGDLCHIVAVVHGSRDLTERPWPDEPA